MPLFRFLRGGLKESLKTTIVVKTFNDLVKAIGMDVNVINADPKWEVKFSVEPYPSKEDNFDSRIGWYTHIVITNLFEEYKMIPIGFLSEPLDSFPTRFQQRRKWNSYFPLLKKLLRNNDDI